MNNIIPPKRELFGIEIVNRESRLIASDKAEEEGNPRLARALRHPHSLLVPPMPYSDKSELYESVFKQVISKKNDYCKNLLSAIHMSPKKRCYLHTLEEVRFPFLDYTGMYEIMIYAMLREDGRFCYRGSAEYIRHYKNGNTLDNREENLIRGCPIYPGKVILKTGPLTIYTHPQDVWRLGYTYIPSFI